MYCLHSWYPAQQKTVDSTGDRNIVDSINALIPTAADRPVNEFDKIVVTGTKSEVKMKNVTEQVLVADSTDIETSGASTTEEFFERMPGVSVARVMGRPQLSINGLAGSYTKF